MMIHHIYERHRPRKRMIQYSAALMGFSEGGDYWIPAFAGMTAGFC